MTSPVIPNSLLCVDGTDGDPPSPFERPNDSTDFFVLELEQHDDVDSWYSCVPGHEQDATLPALDLPGCP